VGELLDSDGLDDSREAEEVSELCSVRSNSMGRRESCQTEDGEPLHRSRDESSSVAVQSGPSGGVSTHGERGIKMMQSYAAKKLKPGSNEPTGEAEFIHIYFLEFKAASRTRASGLSAAFLK